MFPRDTRAPLEVSNVAVYIPERPKQKRRIAVREHCNQGKSESEEDDEDDGTDVP